MVDPLENLVVDSLLLSALPFQTSLKMQNLVKDTVSQFLDAIASPSSYHPESVSESVMFSDFLINPASVSNAGLIIH